MQEVNLGAEGLVPFEVHAGSPGCHMAGQPGGRDGAGGLIRLERSAGGCVV